MDSNSTATETNKPRSPSLLDAAIPIVALVVMLGFTVYTFGLDSLGPNMVPMIVAAGIAGVIGIKNGIPWAVIEEGIVDTIRMGLRAVLILMLVGALIGSWMLSGTVPTIIYYGVQIVSPEFFYATACIVCAAVGISIGSSWTTAGTIGIGLMGIAGALGLNPVIAAGAIISGAYFGDKLSPLSDTTNLAAAVTNNDLFRHIQHMVWTTAPAITLALIAFTVLGLGAEGTATLATIEQLNSTLNNNFTISPLMLIPLLVMLAMAFKKLPAITTLLISSLIGLIFAFVFQWPTVAASADMADASSPLVAYKAALTAMYSGFSSDTGMVALDDLLSRGGISSMLPTVGLILCALSFGGVMETTGLLVRIVEAMLRKVKTAGGLVAATVTTCLGTNILTADQYISIVLPGRMYAQRFEQQGLDARNLSRTLEDSGTLTSVLIPWNTCGAFMSATLGVATFSYAPYAVFNWICPLLAIVYGYLHIKLPKLATANSEQAMP